jgi:hypothetical protein
MNNTEVWKDIPNYEGLYQVSNIGNVKSLGNDKARKERILKPGKDGNGYYQVILSKEGKRKTMAVHVLVAIAFLGHIPDGTHRIVPDHKDGDKSNNGADNLELITQSENIKRYWSTQKTSSQYTGVYWNKPANKWVTQIYVDRKRKHIGCFTDEYEAHLAYQKALNQLINK